MSISTYFRSNIHQHGPEILGVKYVLSFRENLSYVGTITNSRSLATFLDEHFWIFTRSIVLKSLQAVLGIL
jgi:hypothetical protein